MGLDTDDCQQLGDGTIWPIMCAGDVAGLQTHMTGCGRMELARVLPKSSNDKKFELIRTGILVELLALVLEGGKGTLEQLSYLLNIILKRQESQLLYYSLRLCQALKGSPQGRKLMLTIIDQRLRNSVRHLNVLMKLGVRFGAVERFEIWRRGWHDILSYIMEKQRWRL